MAQQTDPAELEYIAGLCHRNALHVLKLAWTTHPHSGFDTAGVQWLSRYIEDARIVLTEDLVDEFAQLMGCFYGECLIAEFGGRWDWSSGQLGVFVESLGYTYPINAVTRQLNVGGPASIATAFLTAVENLFPARTVVTPTSRPPTNFR